MLMRIILYFFFSVNIFVGMCVCLCVVACTVSKSWLTGWYSVYNMCTVFDIILNVIIKCTLEVISKAYCKQWSCNVWELRNQIKQKHCYQILNMPFFPRLTCLFDLFFAFCAYFFFASFFNFFSR